MKKDNPLSNPAALGAFAKGDMENFLVAATPGGIEAQEAQGQMDESFRETLPKKLQTPQTEFEKLGFVFGEAADDIFTNVRFPAGWRKKPTSHSMWTEIRDGKDRVRGLIFYKAAFYDRHAHASLVPRFSTSDTQYDDEHATHVTVYVKDESRLVNEKRTGLPKPNWDNRDEATKRYDAIRAAHDELRAWLTTHYPDWQSPVAYWDDPK